MADSMPGSRPVLPTLLGDACIPYRARPSTFLAAFLLQTAGLVAVVWSIAYFSPKGGMHPLSNVISGFAPVSFLPTSDEPSGGGGGGDRSKTAASKGALPRMTLQDQLTPPQAVLNRPEPKLPEIPTIMAITDTRLPQLGQWGNPLANVVAPPSNGSGERGGLGSDCCGGVGATHGRGFGDSDGPVYRPGVAGVTLPRAIYDPDPEYSEEARHSRYQGSVVLFLIVDAQGQPRDLRLQRSLGMGLDEKAMAAVSKWRFQPATLHGLPVATQINVEVTFRLF
ncbi:MAG TPA: energy transducer TonB [Terriglobales bacterium]|nr:energy transducer TonB [Terriglobales bacterium]